MVITLIIKAAFVDDDYRALRPSRKEGAVKKVVRGFEGMGVVLDKRDGFGEKY